MGQEKKNKKKLNHLHTTRKQNNHIKQDVEEKKNRQKRGESMKNYTIAVAGTGYVGLSIATLLSQHHTVYAVDKKVEKIIQERKSNPG